MADVNLKTLVGKLNSTCQRTLVEGALALCMQRTNYSVEIEHWLFKLLESSNTDLIKIMRQFDANINNVNRELTRALDQFRIGNQRPPDFSPDFITLMTDSWTLTSLEYNSFKIRSGYVLAALLTNKTLLNRLRQSSPELAKIPADKLIKEMKTVIAGTAEDAEEAAAAPSEAGAGVGQEPRPGSKTPALDQFTTNLTAVAKSGKIDPVVGRDFEIRQVIDILTRRRQNNPILTGEAGVGKTAVVEGFALRIAQGDVPSSLKNVQLHTLDLGLLQAGAGVKGEFENRLKNVISEVRSSPTPVILFIDEAHTIIGAGGAAGQGDAANLLKPALARGELRTNR